jgi:YD repeat-containing protein
MVTGSGTWWVSGARRRLLVAAPFLLASLLACGTPDPESSNGPAPPPTLELLSGASMVIDHSYPEKPPATYVTVRVSGVSGPIEFSAGEMELFGSGGELLATLHGSLEPRTPGPAGLTSFLATDPNRDLLAVCDATSLRISVRTSDCRCDTLLEGPVAVSCYPDVRAGDVLAEPGLAAPEGKPCAMTAVMTILGQEEMLEHRYRYDAEGRVRFVDTYDDGTTFTERVAVSRTPAGYLSERQVINAETGLMISRVTYTYGPDGLLSTTEEDGYARGFIDGEIDRVGNYFLSETPWRLETLLLDSGESFMDTLSYFPNAVTTDGDRWDFTGPLESPNQFFALAAESLTLASELEMPRLLSASMVEYTYDAEGRVMSGSGARGLAQLRLDYSYDCP